MTTTLAPAAVRERPILFSAPMVRAILDGRKSQTRRPLAVQPLDILLPGDARQRSLASVTRQWGERRVWFGLTHRGETPDENRGVAFACRHGEVGDRLWVRETWAPMCREATPLCFCETEEDRARHHYVEYRADGSDKYPGGWPDDEADADYVPRWRPSIHMPRAASRLTLELTGVRVERVQDISEADAEAEGLTKRGHWWDVGADWQGDGIAENPVDAYAHLWDSLNASRGYGWDANPWVFVLEFRRAEA